ncbi:MAG: hypothetical protein JW704_10195 [Anaerolineaceae bacterium]|nr:hypothetical protein [Anaerolineaceae bacterium]MBN2677863.1 hypothetical protein [Anaerolineaceae bacterium]
MHQLKKSLILINILGGLAVLGSYAWGFLTFPNAADILWGGVPPDLRPVYTVSMFLAAAGYFIFSIFILHLDADKAEIPKKNGYRIFNALYAVILISSALWLPLTMLTIRQASPLMVWLVRLDLAVVAIASLGLFHALLKVHPRKTAWLQRLAVLGCVFFCFQTVVLDAIVWALNFHL